MPDYDQSVCIFSPEGKILQLQYSMESPKLGATLLAIQSDKCKILISIRKPFSKLAQCLPKTFQICETIGCGVSGIYTDCKKLIKMMREKAVDHYYLSKEQISIKQLLFDISLESQQRTQFHGYRPFCCSLVLLSPEGIYVLNPDADYQKYSSISIGKNSLTVNSKLPETLQKIKDFNLEQLVEESLKLLVDAGEELDEWNQVEIAVYDQNKGFYQMKEEDVKKCVEQYVQKYPKKQQEEDTK